jgi:putative endonuclease
MRATGKKFEQLAARWLQARGVQPLQRNFSCRVGEIDLIAVDGVSLVFVEVRARSNPRFASAAASVDRRKQQRLLRAAQCFLLSNPQLAHMPCRFDVIAIEPRQSPAQHGICWIRGAFTQ